MKLTDEQWAERLEQAEYSAKPPSQIAKEMVNFFQNWKGDWSVFRYATPRKKLRETPAILDIRDTLWSMSYGHFLLQYMSPDIQEKIAKETPALYYSLFSKVVRFNKTWPKGHKASLNALKMIADKLPSKQRKPLRNMVIKYRRMIAD